MTKGELLKKIRLKCMQCTADQPSEIRLCPVEMCELYNVRDGKDPEPSKRGFALRGDKCKTKNQPDAVYVEKK